MNDKIIKLMIYRTLAMLNTSLVFLEQPAWEMAVRITQGWQLDLWSKEFCVHTKFTLRKALSASC